MFFDVALLWQPENISISESRRRECALKLPSWSWVSWKGKIQIESWNSGCFNIPEFARSAMYEDNCYAFKQSYRTVSWTILHNLQQRVINCNFLEHSLDAFQEQTNSFKPPVELPEGWKYRPNREGSRQVLPGYFYNDQRFGKTEPFCYPIPEPSHDLLFMEPSVPYLYGRTLRGWFGLGCPFISLRGSIDLGILDKDQQCCGMVRFLEIQEIGKFNITEYSSEFISLSRTQSRPLPELPYSWEEAEGLGIPDLRKKVGERNWKGRDYRFYNVMLIERKEDIAFRKGLGWIVADVWERYAIETIDVKLG